MKAEINSLIEESRKIRLKRGDDFLINKAIEKESLVVPQVLISCNKATASQKDFRSLRDSHLKLAHLVVEYDRKIFDKSNQEMGEKKPRSKSVHLYIDEKIESFLKAESEKSHTKWGLRKNAGLGSLIQKFILNFVELKKREDRQLKKIKKIINEFRESLVEFKKKSADPDDYLQAEGANQKMKALSNDMMILLSLLEFEDESLKTCLGDDLYRWIDFVVKWKFQS
jgi:hypothetical protein